VCVCVCVCVPMNQRRSNFHRQFFFDSFDFFEPSFLNFMARPEKCEKMKEKYLHPISSFAQNFFFSFNFFLFSFNRINFALNEIRRKDERFDKLTLLLDRKFELIANFYESNYVGYSFSFPSHLRRYVEIYRKRERRKLNLT
jgi:hypothetical protein